MPIAPGTNYTRASKPQSSEVVLKHYMTINPMPSPVNPSSALTLFPGKILTAVKATTPVVFTE
jgi:hypothetical protein